MFIYRIGSPVHIGEHPTRITATILGVSMTGDNFAKVNYLCSWWDDKTHKEEWLDCYLVEPCEETMPMISVKMLGV